MFQIVLKFEIVIITLINITKIILDICKKKKRRYNLFSGLEVQDRARDRVRDPDPPADLVGLLYQRQGLQDRL